MRSQCVFFKKLYDKSANCLQQRFAIASTANRHLVKITVISNNIRYIIAPSSLAVNQRCRRVSHRRRLVNPKGEGVGGGVLIPGLMTICCKYAFSTTLVETFRRNVSTFYYCGFILIKSVNILSKLPLT